MNFLMLVTLLTLGSSVLGAEVADIDDLSMFFSQILAVSETFQRYCQRFLDERIRTEQISSSEVVAYPRRHLIKLLTEHHPWIDKKHVEKMSEDFSERNLGLTGVFSVKLENDSYVGGVVIDGTLRGGLLSFHDQRMILKNLESNSGSGEELIFYLQSIIYKNATGTFITCLDEFSRNPKCLSIQVLDNFRTKGATLEGVSVIESHFITPRFQVEEELSDLEIPDHLWKEAQKKNEELEVLSAMISLDYINNSLKPLKSMIRSQRLFEKSNEKMKPFLTVVHDYWKKVLAKDSDCAKFSNMFYPYSGALIRVRLGCFPGSGSKWVMEMLQFASGIGNELNARFPPSLLFKTHHDTSKNIVNAYRHGYHRKSNIKVRIKEIIDAQGRAVLVIRNPYDALVSWWNHHQTENPKSIGLPEEALKESLKGSEFCDFAEREIEMWRILHLDYIYLVSDLLVMHHERTLQDPMKYLKRLMAFLGVPLDNQRLECLQRHPFEMFKRKQVKDNHQVSCSKVMKLIEDAISEINEALEEKHFDPLPTNLYRKWNLVESKDEL